MKCLSTIASSQSQYRLCYLLKSSSRLQSSELVVIQPSITDVGPDPSLCGIDNCFCAQGAISCIVLHETGARVECASACTDGSCILWDLHTGKRRASLTAATAFKSIAFHPDGSQLVTVGAAS